VRLVRLEYLVVRVLPEQQVRVRQVRQVLVQQCQDHPVRRVLLVRAQQAQLVLLDHKVLLVWAQQVQLVLLAIRVPLDLKVLAEL
jgi:hypothetical protein